MTIVLATSEDINGIVDLIQKRIDWMDQTGINHWNKSDYLKTFSLSYFDSVIKNKNLFQVLDFNDELIGGFTLFQSDRRWTDNIPALYIHNFVSKIDTKGVGDAIITFCEKEAIQRGINTLRIDCQQQNAKLNAYYEERGFYYVSSFDEPLYQGNRREKKLF